MSIADVKGVFIIPRSGTLVKWRRERQLPAQQVSKLSRAAKNSGEQAARAALQKETAVLM